MLLKYCVGKYQRNSMDDHYKQNVFSPQPHRKGYCIYQGGGITNRG